jgi:dihydrolipoamide dehydrogenase
MEETNILVIGGGPGGYVAAIRAGQLDLDTTLVEMEAVGGTCLNYGCIPSKALISATDVAHEARRAESRGIQADPSIDAETMNDWKDSVVDQLTGGVETLCEQAGVDVIEGRAEFTDETTARIITDTDESESNNGDNGNGDNNDNDDDSNTDNEIEFDHAIVATGSRPVELPNFEFNGETILNSRDALALDTIPDNLLVIGAGYIGMELSIVYSKLGTDVTVVEMLDRTLPAYEEDIAETIQSQAEDYGVEFHFGQNAEEWEENEDGDENGDGDGGDGNQITIVTETNDGEQTEFNTDQALVAVGREPVTDTLNLDAVGLEPNDDGFLETDSQGRTDLDHVFAVGDVAGEPLLAHKGMKEGEVAAEVIAGEPSAMDYQTVPAAVFTDPEVGTAGMTEAEAEDAEFDPIVGTMPLEASGRALTLGETNGFIRVVGASDGGYILGAQIVAPEASELIAEFGLAIEMGATLEDVAQTIHTHPTLGEAAREAAASALDKAIHTT